MGVLPAAAKSFKVDRKSYFATILKSIISDHLRRLCPNFSDDVLTEYITVLVCNGKNQHQARDDLEAFLGGLSEEFVSWLWNALSKYEPSLSSCISSKANKPASNPRDTYREMYVKGKKARGVQSQGNSNLMEIDGQKPYSLSAKICKSQDVLYVGNHSSHVKKRMSTTIHPSGPRTKSAKISSSTKVVSSLGKYQTRNADNSQESEMPFPLLGRRLGSFPQNVTLSTTHPSKGSKLQEPPRKHWTETVLERSISPLTFVASSHDNKPRQSVWDRLGKPIEDSPAKSQITEFYAMDKTRTNKERTSLHLPVAERIGHRPPLPQKHGEQVVQLSTSCPTPKETRVKNMGYVHHIVENAGADKISYRKGQNFTVEAIHPVAPVSNIGRKRHFSDLSTQTDDDAAPEVVLQARKRPEVSSEASQVLLVNDVKRRLRQFEIEMTKLRSKQVEMHKDGNTKFVNHGAMKATEEDNARTIHVTNVHYKATKEALSMFFGKCGVVLDVVVLTDANKSSVTQRSAYITFESKESFDKALGLNGTTFYSRTITVSRKGEPNSDRFTEKMNQVAASDPKRGVFPDKPSFLSSHLQWRRESTNSESPTKSTIVQMISGTSFSEKCQDSK